MGSKKSGKFARAADGDIETHMVNDRSLVYDLKQKIRRLTIKNGKLEHEVKNQTVTVKKLTQLLDTEKVEANSKRLVKEKEQVKIQTELERVEENF